MVCVFVCMCDACMCVCVVCTHVCTVCVVPVWLCVCVCVVCMAHSVYVYVYCMCSMCICVCRMYKCLGCVYVCIGEGNGTPLQYPCLENPMGGGAWWAAVHGVDRSRTRLSDFTFFTFTSHFSLSCIGEGNGNPLQRSCLENPRDGRSLVGFCLWGRTESDTTEATWQQQQHVCMCDVWYMYVCV